MAESEKKMIESMIERHKDKRIQGTKETNKHRIKQTKKQRN